MVRHRGDTVPDHGHQVTAWWTDEGSPFMGRHDAPEPQSGSLGNTDPGERGRGGDEPPTPVIGQPTADTGKHAADD